MRSTERNGDHEATLSMVGRVAAILGTFTAENPVLGVSEIARGAGLAKSSTSRIVQELVAFQFLERSGTGVRLGLRVFELGETAARPRDLRKVALASMSDLRNAVNLTVHLAVLERGEVVYIEILPARGTPRLPSRVGGRMPAHATGVGKALLAYSDPHVLDDMIAAGLTSVGPRTVTDPARLYRELARVRSTGIAYEREESGAGIACAAACIRGASGEPLAAISAAGWDADFDVRRVGLAVHTAALAIAREVARRPGLRL
ncbi:IclR family transcriptional regulator [Microbacterium sp. ARD31]|uniref:IclR family transcriptional regulator n=1 Tax=Microbacterium sp. ARD31 TaxID=2962576 RepID=UPI002881D4F1|nr:IclR family transcriptional regulator [Microbacterium sp. ARD31]MDT0183975.1 IclR family transcriptional regulator [Microbacterium sp. ARD31]